MDKSLFLMIGALTSNLHQGHSGRPARLHIFREKFLEGFGFLGYQESSACAPVKIWWRGSKEVGERRFDGY